MWIPLVEKFGGQQKAASDPDCQAAVRYHEETKCFLSYERSFFRPVFQ
jgi:hypothetical protein